MLGLLALAVLLVACSEGEESNLGGDGLPVKNPTETYGNASASLSTEVVLEPNGCWTTDLGSGKALVIFPEGWTKDDSGLRMTSADGSVSVGDGDTVEALGGAVPAESFPGVPDGYWGGYLEFCDPPLEQFVVLDDVLGVSGRLGE